MKVLALTEGPNHVCYRYRIEAFGPALLERGWTLESLPLAPGTFQRSGQLRAAAGADVVILQRKLLPMWQVQMLRRYARRLVYDFDDALFIRDSYSRKGPLSWARLAHFWATIYASDAVIAGNQFLRETAAAYIRPEQVQHVPTCVNPAFYRLATHQRRGAEIRLVWIGQHVTLSCLNLAQPRFVAIGQALPGVELRVICNRFPELEGIRVVPRTWSMASEASELADCDIGISWLPDDSWSRGKCGLKVLQYMAAGLPVVATPVGMNTRMVEHGVTGFVVNSPEEWAQAVERLANDPALRRRMGEAGRRRVVADFSVERWSPVFVDLLEQLAGSAPAPRLVERPLPLKLRQEHVAA